MKYKIKAKVWLWVTASGSSKGAWYFVTIPPEISEKIRLKHKKYTKGWGSLPVKVYFGGEDNTSETILETSIFPNNKDKNVFTYFLALKKSIRSEVGIQDGDIVDFQLEIKN